MAKKKTAPKPHSRQEMLDRKITEIIAARMARMNVKPGSTAFARGRFLAASDVMARALHGLNEAAGFGVAALQALTDAGVELDRLLGKRSAPIQQGGKLTREKVQRLSKPGRYGDGDGLWLQVSETGAKSWLFRYKVGGRESQMGLGSAKTISLDHARHRARAARIKVAEGKDPITAERKKRAALVKRTAKRKRK